MVDVDTSLNVGKPELSVQLDRLKAADLGVQVADAAEALRLLVGGDQVTTYNEGGEQYEVHVRALQTSRATAAAIGQLTVPSTQDRERAAREHRGPDAGHVAERRSIGSNRQRQVTVFAGLLPGVSQTPAMAAMTQSGRIARTWGRATARGSPGGRASSAARRRTSCSLSAVAGVHVSDPGGAVRVVAASDHDPPVAAADAAIRAAVDHHLRGSR